MAGDEKGLGDRPGGCSLTLRVRRRRVLEQALLQHGDRAQQLLLRRLVLVLLVVFLLLLVDLRVVAFDGALGRTNSTVRGAARHPLLLVVDAAPLDGGRLRPLLPGRRRRSRSPRRRSAAENLGQEQPEHAAPARPLLAPLSRSPQQPAAGAPGARPARRAGAAGVRRCVKEARGAALLEEVEVQIEGLLLLAQQLRQPPPAAAAGRRQ
jgi:hypothetical protein